MRRRPPKPPDEALTVKHILELEKRIMVSQADLDAKLGTLQTAIADLAARVAALTPTPVDLTAEAASVDQAIAAVNSIAPQA